MAGMSDEQASQAVARLNELTQEGEVSWITTDPDALEDHVEGKVQASVFETKYTGKRLFLYKHATEHYVHPDEARLTGMPPGETYTKMEVRLEIVDSDGKPVWTFPKSSALKDLYSTVSYHASGAGELIGQLVEEDE